MQKLRYLYNARIFLNKIFHFYSPHMYSFFKSVNLIFGEVAQHQSQCSIFVNQQFKVSNIFLFVLFLADHYLAFIPLLTHAHQTVYRLLSLSKASNPFPKILQQLFGIQNQVSAMSRSELYLLTIFYPQQLRL